MRWFKWLFWESRYIISPFYLLIPPFFITDIYLEPYFKYSGLMLRLIGFALIIVGINKKLKNFTGRGIERIFIEWWNKRPGQSKSATISGSAGSNSKAHGNLSVSRNFKEETTEEKLKFLLEYVEILDNKITDLNRKIKNTENKILATIKEVETDLKIELRKIRDNVEVGFVGKINLEVLGALSIILGVIFSSITMQLISIYS